MAAHGPDTGDPAQAPVVDIGDAFTGEKSESTLTVLIAFGANFPVAVAKTWRTSTCPATTRTCAGAAAAGPGGPDPGIPGGRRLHAESVRPGRARSVKVRQVRQPTVAAWACPAEQAGHTPNSSTSWLMSAYPNSVATLRAHRSTLGASTSSVRPHTRQTRW